MSFTIVRRVGIAFLVLAWAAAQVHAAPWPPTVGPSDFYRLPGSPPCRVLDTFLSPPDVTMGSPRTIPMVGVCGVPANAVAVVLNVTVVNPTMSGDLTLYPPGVDPTVNEPGDPEVASISYEPNKNRAKLLVVGLSETGDLVAEVSAGTVRLIIDVSGYFMAALPVDDTTTVAEDAVATTVDVLANDFNPNGDTITITAVTQPANGTVVIAGDSLSVTYEPNDDYCNSDEDPAAPDTFTYTIAPTGLMATVSVTVTCENDAPTDILLDDNNVSEGLPAGTLVGNLSTTDVDAGDTYTYTLVAGAGDTDNASFQIVGDQLRTNAVFDLETKASYSVRIRSTDAGGLFTEKQFTINVTDVNDEPTDISLTPSSVDENQPVGTAVGTFSTTDPDAGDTHTYTLVAGVGDTDNASFQIVGDQLQTNAVFDLEVKGSYSIRVRSTDVGGLFVEEAFTIIVDNVNEQPTDIALDNTTVDENQPAGAPVGNFSTTDMDAGDTFTYTLAAGAGDTDNASFQIAGNQLQTAAVLDFETKDSYSIRVRSTDAGGLFTEKQFTITLAGVNEQPTDIALSGASVAEDAPLNTPVGTFSTTDPDAGDTFTYTLVAGTGDTDNGSFTIVGDQLQTNALFDFETKSSYSIRVRSSDAGGLFFEKVFTITIANVNEAPTDIDLSNATIAENQASGTAVGNFTTTDADTGDTFTYTLVAGVGSTDNGSFTIVGNQLQTAAVLDFETKSSYDIRVRSTDAGGLFFEKQFTITVTNVNEAPTDIALSNATIAEAQPSATPVGNFSTTDSDAGDTFTYTLEAGAGSTDNGSFAIVGNELRTAAVLDFETKSSYSIRVRSTDSGGLFFEKVFVISVTNVNEAPTDIALTPSSVNEAQPSGTPVGSFSTTDPDAGDTFTYTLMAGAGDTDNGSFTIVGNQLQTNAVFDFETKSSYSIRVRSTDSGVLSFEKVFVITVVNVNEAPTDIALSNASVAENQPVNTAVGTFTTTDPDTGDTLTYALVAGAGDTDNGSFTIDGDQLRTEAVFDFETKSSYSIRVRSTDSGGLSFEKSFTITIINANEAPTAIALDNANVNENQPSSTLVGDFSTIDPDEFDTFTYTLVAGDGSTDNGSLAIVGNQLRTAVMFDFEAKNSYSIRVRSTDAGGLFVEQQFTIAINNLPEAPIAGNDAFDTVGNTLLEVGPTSSEPEPKVYFNGNVLSNDVDPDGPTVLTASLVSSTPGAVVTLNSDGTFTYVPPAGATGTDSFTYNVSDGDLTSAVPGTVTITLKGRVWYVKNDHAAGGLGRSNDPFDTLAEAESASGDNDTIHIFRGDGTITNQNTGIALKNGQRLLGEGVALTVPVSVNGGPATTTLRALGTHPVIHNNTDDPGEDHGVSIQATAGNRTNIEIRGLNISGRDNGIDVTATGAHNAEVTISDSAITSDGVTGLEGIDVNAAGTGTVTVTVDVNNLSGRGNAFDARTSAAGALRINLSNNPNILSQTASGIVIDGSGGGTTTITGFANNSVDPNTPGTGISVTNAIFDQTPGGTFQTVNAGTTLVGASGNGVGGSGMVLANVQGDLSFTDLDIFADGGAGLRASSPAAYTGSAGLQLAVSSPGVAIIEATGGPAVDVATAAINLPLSSLRSTNSPTTGVALNSVTGTFSAGSGSTISNITSAAGTAFQVGSSSATVTYNGTITTNQGRGVSLTGNTGSTIGFTGALTLSSGTNPAFTATGGGTVTASDTTSTLTTTTATALNVANTTIGAGGLRFRSISSNGGGNSGIVLNTTGALGGLSVLGNGGSCSSAANCTGGAIQNKTVNGVSLNNTRSVSLSNMFIDNNDGSGVFGDDVTDFTLANSRVTNNSDTATGTEAGLRFNELLGNSAITNSTISGSFEDEVRITPASGVLTNLAISGSTFGPNSATTGGNLVSIIGTATAEATVNVTGSTFNGARASAFLSNFSNTGRHTVNISGSIFRDNGKAISLLTNQSADLNFNVSNNLEIVRSLSNAIEIVASTDCTNASEIRGTISGNVIGDSNPDSGSRNLHGIVVDTRGDERSIISITNNTVRHVDLGGIWVSDSDFGTNAAENGRLDLTLRDNVVTDIDDNSGAPCAHPWGTFVESRHGSTMCVDMASNTSVESPMGCGGAHFRIRQRDTSTYFLERLSDGDGTPGELLNNAATVQAFAQAENDPGSTVNVLLATGFTEASNGFCQKP